MSTAALTFRFRSRHSTRLKLGRLRSRLGELVEPREVTVDVTIPYDRGDLVARLHNEGRVDAVEHTDAGTRVKARVPAATAAALQQYLIA